MPIKYSRWNRFFQRLNELVAGSGWPAQLAYHVGFQRSVSVEGHAIVVPQSPSSMPEVTIAFASDFHAGPVTHPRLLEAACQALRSSRPDVVLLGGDFVSFQPSNADSLAKLLAEIHAPLGKFAVLGNHDLWAGADQIVRKLRTADIRVLCNQNVQLPQPHESIWICGLDDGFYGQPDPESAFEGAEGVRIVLMHSPAGLTHVQNHDFLLALCGHTHGGQIALPGGRPILLPRGSLCRKHACGRFELNPGRTMIVSRGVGCSAVPFRIFADADVVVCKLTPQCDVSGRGNRCGAPLSDSFVSAQTLAG